MILIKELDQNELDLCYELDLDTISLWTKKQWQGELSKKGVKVIAFFLRNEIIGVYVVQIIIDEAHLNYFSIKQKFRKKGYGSKLMSYLIKECKKSNIDKLLLEVSETNSVAEIFYCKFNFVTVGRRKNYYKNGADAVLKEKKIIN